MNLNTYDRHLFDNYDVEAEKKFLEADMRPFSHWRMTCSGSKERRKENSSRDHVFHFTRLKDLTLQIMTFFQNKMWIMPKGNQNKNNCLVSNVYNKSKNLPHFSPTYFTRRKVREISTFYRNCLQGGSFYLDFPLK